MNKTITSNSSSALSHGMKSTGGMLGFQAIADTSARLEQAAENADTDPSRK